MTSEQSPPSPPDGRWTAVARAAGLLGDDGAPQATIFARMTALAAATGSVNLGQGYPDADGPHEVRRGLGLAGAAGFVLPPGDDGRLRVVVDGVHPAADAALAHRRAEQHPVGKVLVRL